MIIICTDLVDLPQIYGNLGFNISMTILSAFSLLYLYLLFLIFRYNRYEFHRLWKKMTLYSVIEMIFYGLIISLLYIVRVNTLYNWFVTAIWLCNIHIICISTSILFLKDFRDMI